MTRIWGHDPLPVIGLVVLGIAWRAARRELVVHTINANGGASPFVA